MGKATAPGKTWPVAALTLDLSGLSRYWGVSFRAGLQPPGAWQQWARGPGVTGRMAHA